MIACNRYSNETTKCKIHNVNYICMFPYIITECIYPEQDLDELTWSGATMKHFIAHTFQLQKLRTAMTTYTTGAKTKSDIASVDIVGK